MDTVLLRTFLEVARLRHFGRAAEHLCVTQSAVSARIKQLEESLGVPLFERRRNDIRITPAGRRLQRHAENIVRGWELARQEVVLQDDIAALLALGFPADLWSILVLDGVVRLLQDQPQLALRLHAVPQVMLIEQLLAGALDAVLLFDPPHLPGHRVRRLTDIPLVLAATPSAGPQPDTAGRDYVYVDWGNAFAGSHAAAHHGPASRVQCNAGFLARDLIERLGGSAYLAQQTLDADGPAAQADAPLIARAAFAVFRADHPQQALLDTLCDVLAADLPPDPMDAVGA